MSLLARLRRVHTEALGLNRRNLDVLQAYNRRPLYAVVDHKQRTKIALAARGLPVPDTYAVCRGPRDLATLAEVVKGLSEFVLKPAHGAGGEGVLVISGREGERYRIGSRSWSSRDLVAHASDILAGAYAISQAHDEALLEYRLRSAPEVEPLSPGGVADVRIIVFRGVPIMAMLRLPTRASGGRANLHAGGIGVGIEVGSGRTGRAIQRGRALAQHPDTGAALHGWAVPAWERMLSLAAEAFLAVPLGYFGIDIVLDASRGPVILEMNARPGLSIQLATGRGLRPVIERVERLAGVEEKSPAERIALGRELA